MFSIYYIPKHIEIVRHPGQPTSKLRKRAIRIYKDEIRKLKELDDRQLVEHFKQNYRGT